MKKNYISFFLILVILFAACDDSSRDNPESADGTPVQFYYAVDQTYQNNQVIKSETRYFETENMVFKQFVELYMQGPLSLELYMPLTPGTEIIDYWYTDKTMSLQLSEDYLDLIGVEKSIADACLALTLTQIDGIDRIQIQTETRALTSREAGGINADSFIITDFINSTDEKTTNLYFADPSRRYLAAEKRPIVAGDAKSLARFIVEELIKGPNTEALESTIPDGVQVLSVDIEDGVCHLNLSGAFLSDINERLAVYSIVNSLTGIDSVNAVYLSVNGERLKYYGCLFLPQPMVRYEQIIYRDDKNEIDATLFLKTWSEEYLAAVPIKVSIKKDMSAQRLVLEALIGFEEAAGYTNPIPKGTKLISIENIGGECHIDLSREFIGSPEQGRLSVNAVAATMCSLDTVDAVYITVEGKETDYGDYPMKGRITYSDKMIFP